MKQLKAVKYAYSVFSCVLIIFGLTAREIRDSLEQNDRDSDIFVAVNTLELLKKSGRVTAAGAALGSILSIKPVLRIQDGKLDAYRKVRGMRSAMEAMVEGLKEDERVLNCPPLHAPGRLRRRPGSGNDLAGNPASSLPPLHRGPGPPAPECLLPRRLRRTGRRNRQGPGMTWRGWFRLSTGVLIAT